MLSIDDLPKPSLTLKVNLENVCERKVCRWFMNNFCEFWNDHRVRKRSLAMRAWHILRAGARLARTVWLKAPPLFATRDAIATFASRVLRMRARLSQLYFVSARILIHTHTAYNVLGRAGRPVTREICELRAACANFPSLWLARATTAALPESLFMLCWLRIVLQHFILYFRVCRCFFYFLTPRSWELPVLAGSCTFSFVS